MKRIKFADYNEWVDALDNTALQEQRLGQRFVNEFLYECRGEQTEKLFYEPDNGKAKGIILSMFIDYSDWNRRADK